MVPRADGSRPDGRTSSASGGFLIARRTGFARCGSFASGPIRWRGPRGNKLRGMTVSTELELQSFVLLRLGEPRFAVSPEAIAELSAPSRVFRSPPRTPRLEGRMLS